MLLIRIKIEKWPSWQLKPLPPRKSPAELQKPDGRGQSLFLSIPGLSKSAAMPALMSASSSVGSSTGEPAQHSLSLLRLGGVSGATIPEKSPEQQNNQKK